MTEAKAILKLIEGGDPSDDTALQTIDWRVDQFIQQSDHGWWVDKRYTLSRDALKAIRPKGYWIKIETGNFQGIEKHHCYMEGEDEGAADRIEAENLATEELAELHAVIQAIEFERAHDK